MLPCIIRAVELTDAPEIATLVTQLGYPTSAAEMEGRLKVLLSQANYTIYVATIEDSVVGMVGAYLGYALEYDGPYGRLTGLVVDEKWRGRGLGKLLMEKIESWVMQRGASWLILTSGVHRTNAHRFYRNLGYQETGLRFAKRLE